MYRQGLEVKLPAGATGQIKLGWQGCADAGLCYPPQSITVDLGGNPAVAATAQAQDQSLASGLQQRSLGWSLLVFFGLGLLLAFAPCSLPMLPILAGLVVGSGASPRRGFALASSYVVCMALVYAALGVLAALLGANLAALLQTPWILGSFAALFVLLALPMFGFFELQLPAFLRDRLDNVQPPAKRWQPDRCRCAGCAVRPAGRPVHDRAPGWRPAVYRPKRQRAARWLDPVRHGHRHRHSVVAAGDCRQPLPARNRAPG